MIAMVIRGGVMMVTVRMVMMHMIVVIKSVDCDGNVIVMIVVTAMVITMVFMMVMPGIIITGTVQQRYAQLRCFQES